MIALYRGHRRVQFRVGTWHAGCFIEVGNQTAHAVLLGLRMLARILRDGLHVGHAGLLALVNRVQLSADVARGLAVVKPAVVGPLTVRTTGIGIAIGSAQGAGTGGRMLDRLRYRPIAVPTKLVVGHLVPRGHRRRRVGCILRHDQVRGTLQFVRFLRCHRRGPFVLHAMLHRHGMQRRPGA